MSDVRQELKREAEAAGLTLDWKSEHHVHIKGGPFLVNYYPFSKKRTAYVASTRRGEQQVTPKRACQMAFDKPAFRPGEAGRRKPQRPHKERLWKRGHTCYWCEQEIDHIDEATVDHVIPLGRGGIDNMNNKVLSCLPCNRDRGHEMPEVSGKAPWEE